MLRCAGAGPASAAQGVENVRLSALLLDGEGKFAFKHSGCASVHSPGTKIMLWNIHRRAGRGGAVLSCCNLERAHSYVPAVSVALKTFWQIWGSLSSSARASGLAVATAAAKVAVAVAMVIPAVLATAYRRAICFASCENERPSSKLSWRQCALDEKRSSEESQA